MKKLTYILLLFYCLFLHSQTRKQEFKGFGSNPTQPHDSLFKNILEATSFIHEFKATEKLINYHNTVGNLDSVIYYSKKLYQKTAQQQKNNEKLSLLSSYIGKAKFNKGLVNDALEWYLTGSTKAKEINNKKLYYRNKVGVALCKLVRQDKDEGVQIIKETIEKSPDKKVQHDAINYYGQLLFIDGNIDQANNHFTKALTFYEQNNFKKEALNMKLRLARVLDAKNKTSEALNKYLSVFQQSFNNNFFDLYITAANDVGGLYAKLNDYENATRILSTVYINSIQWNNLDAQKKVLKILHLLHKKTGDYKNAYAIMTQLRTVDNAILKNQNTTQVNELEVKYKTLEKEQEIQRQKTQKQNILIGFLVVLIPLLGLFYTYYQKLQTQSKLNQTLKEVNNQKVASLLKDQELQLIKASVEGEEKERKRIAKELHDSIGGNLATIKLQLSTEKHQNIITQLDDTYNQVRDLSHNLMPKKFQEKTFSLLVSNYINTVKRSSREEISLHIHPEKNINQLNDVLKIELYKIIQELLTNALKHAKANEINIHITQLDGEVKLLFEDDGIGFETTNLHEGIGFKNIRERLETINGTMRIDSYPNRGTIIDIDVSLT